MMHTEIPGQAVSIIVGNGWNLPSIPEVPVETRELFRKKYYGPDCKHQEAIKAHGLQFTAEGNLEAQLLGFHLIGYSYFYRSEEATTNKGNKHPEFREYMSHLVHSDPSFFPKPVFNALSRMYTAPVKCKIGKGKSFWPSGI